MVHNITVGGALALHVRQLDGLAARGDRTGKVRLEQGQNGGGIAGGVVAVKHVLIAPEGVLALRHQRHVHCVGGGRRTG